MLLLYFSAPTLVSFMLSRASQRVLARYSRRVLFFAGFGLLIPIYGILPGMWMANFPPSYAVFTAMHTLIAWVCAGLVIGWIVRRPGSAADGPSPATLGAILLVTFAAPVSAQEGPLPGMTFVDIPSGIFTMGVPPHEVYRALPWEGPQRQVTVGAFQIMTHEVTQAQWSAVMETNPSRTVGAHHPVENLSWELVQEFISRLNEMDPGRGYRLPTEAEWEYAARAGTTTRFFFGESETELDRYAWFRANSGGRTHPVGQKEPNPWGLYDILGNVWEWCQDWYHDSYEGAPTDGSAVERPGEWRTKRGGGWHDYALACRSAMRWSHGTDFQDWIGIRLVRSSQSGFDWSRPAPPGSRYSDPTGASTLHARAWNWSS